MFSEDELIPISVLQHYSFRPRQVALIHLEQLWEENLYTAQGNVLHDRVDVVHHESRRNVRTEYGMAIRSLEYGLIGKADVVEFEFGSDKSYKSIIPVEFKRGKQKVKDHDRVQLYAQALCLEEMFQINIPEGQFYYLQEHRRSKLIYSDELKIITKQIIKDSMDLLLSGKTPKAYYEKKRCDRCSLVDICMPRAVDKGGKKVDRYIQTQLRWILKDLKE
ncbi:MAG: CRISPR-associated protein Cas4 [Spirochaetaceae bacterium]|nr:CRISPR-associated protein Cas4 [Spirochaetaceae bacterium]